MSVVIKDSAQSVPDDSGLVAFDRDETAKMIDKKIRIRQNARLGESYAAIKSINENAAVMESDRLSAMRNAIDYNDANADQALEHIFAAEQDLFF